MFVPTFLFRTIVQKFSFGASHAAVFFFMTACTNAHEAGRARTRGLPSSIHLLAISRLTILELAWVFLDVARNGSLEKFTKLLLRQELLDHGDRDRHFACIAVTCANERELLPFGSGKEEKSNAFGAIDVFATK